MVNKILIALCSMLLALTSAQALSSMDNCTKGSDAECLRFGSDMCCAEIKYTFEGKRKQFYSCVSLLAIMEDKWFTSGSGKITKIYGFEDGTWTCVFASSL